MSDEKLTVGRISFSPYKIEEVDNSKERINAEMLDVRLPEKLAEKYIEVQQQLSSAQEKIKGLEFNQTVDEISIDRLCDALLDAAIDIEEENLMNGYIQAEEYRAIVTEIKDK